MPGQGNTQERLSKLKTASPQRKIGVTSNSPVGEISVVTLIRTDTPITTQPLVLSTVSCFLRELRGPPATHSPPPPSPPHPPRHHVLKALASLRLTSIPASSCPPPCSPPTPLLSPPSPILPPPSPLIPPPSPLPPPSFQFPESPQRPDTQMHVHGKGAWSSWVL